MQGPEDLGPGEGARGGGGRAGLGEGAGGAEAGVGRGGGAEAGRGGARGLGRGHGLSTFLGSPQWGLRGPHFLTRHCDLAPSAGLRMRGPAIVRHVSSFQKAPQLGFNCFPCFLSVPAKQALPTWWQHPFISLVHTVVPTKWGGVVGAGPGGPLPPPADFWSPCVCSAGEPGDPPANTDLSGEALLPCETQAAPGKGRSVTGAGHVSHHGSRWV